MLKFDFSNTKLSLKRSITSYTKIQKLVSILIRNRYFHISKNTTYKKYLDLGCGPNTNSKFINLDYIWHPSIDICWDVTNGIPIRSNSLKGIFTEHCLEHLSLYKADKVLNECWRVLKPGGIIRIIVPDGELYLSNYYHFLNGDNKIEIPYSENDYYEGLYSPIMSVNRIFRDHGHIFIFDFDTIYQLLNKIGFIDISKESFNSGRDNNLLIDTESRKIESLYVEAAKPLNNS